MSKVRSCLAIKDVEFLGRRLIDCNLVQIFKGERFQFSHVKPSCTLHVKEEMLGHNDWFSNAKEFVAIFGIKDIHLKLRYSV